MKHECLLQNELNVYPFTDDMLLQEDLIQILPMVGEANAISEELNKKANFEVMLMAPYLLHGKKEGRTEVRYFSK